MYRLLDVLAGRVDTGIIEGTILVNGQDTNNEVISNIYKDNRGFMLQLAEAFNPELTTRQNLVWDALQLGVPELCNQVYAALMRMPAGLPTEAKLRWHHARHHH